MRAAGVCALLAAAGFGVRTYWRNFDWADELTFFRHTIASGGDVPRARMGLASSLQSSQGRFRRDRRSCSASWPSIRRIGRRRSTWRTHSARIGPPRRGQADLGEGVYHAQRQSDPREIIAAVASLDLLEDGPDWPARRRSRCSMTACAAITDSWELVQLRTQDFERAGTAPRGARHWRRSYSSRHIGGIIPRGSRWGAISARNSAGTSEAHRQLRASQPAGYPRWPMPSAAAAAGLHGRPGASRTRAISPSRAVEPRSRIARGRHLELAQALGQLNDQRRLSAREIDTANGLLREQADGARRTVKEALAS